MGLNQTVTYPVNGKPTPIQEYSTISNGQEYFSTGLVTCENNVGPGLPPSCRMNPNFDAMQYVETGGDSYYNSLQVVLNKRLGHGLEVQSAYTYAQNLDTTASNMDGNDCGSGGATGFDPLNPQNDKGPSCADVRNNWRFNLLYHAPTIKSDGIAAKFLNGWWMGNIISAQGGYPFTPTLTSNRSVSGVFNGLTGQGDRPNYVTAASAGTATDKGVTETWVPYDPNTVILGTPQNWYNPLMFNLQPMVPCPGMTSLTCGTLGDESRGFLRGPNLFDWDFSIVKDTKLGFLGEQGSLQFRAEFFNILNHTNFGFPSTGSYAGTSTDLTALSELTGRGYRHQAAWDCGANYHDRNHFSPDSTGIEGDFLVRPSIRITKGLLRNAAGPFYFTKRTKDGMKISASRSSGFVGADVSLIFRDRSGIFLFSCGRLKYNPPAAKEVAEKVTKVVILRSIATKNPSFFGHWRRRDSSPARRDRNDDEKKLFPQPVKPQRS